MSAVKEIILGKLEHLEALSEPVLLEVLDFVSFFGMAAKHKSKSIADEFKFTWDCIGRRYRFIFAWDCFIFC